MDLTIVIPCFNEVANLGILTTELMPVVDALRQDLAVEVVFVDDGSTDGTGDSLNKVSADRTDVRVVRHDSNYGLGAALHTGFEQARGSVVVTTDSDGTYPFSLIPPMLSLLRPGVDIVTASCYHPAGGVENVPRYRIFLSRTASLLYRTILDPKVHTYTCLFRAYRRQVIRSVSFKSEDFLAVTELLARAMLQGYRVAEMPCTLRVRRHGSSKAQVVRITASHLLFQWQLLRERSGSTASAALAHGTGDPHGEDVSG